MLKDDLIPGCPAAAAYTGLKESTIYHLASTGRIPSRKMGKKLYFLKSELDLAFRSASEEPAVTAAA